MSIEHKDIPAAELHELKGASGAQAGAIFVATGANASSTTDNSNTPANMYDNEFRRPALRDIAEVLNAAGNITGATTVNCETANVYTGTLTGDVTFTFSNPPASGKVGTLTLILTQDGTGNRTITWPGTVVWAGGTPPTISTGATDVDIFTFMTTTAGGTWYGFTGGINFS